MKSTLAATLAVVLLAPPVDGRAPEGRAQGDAPPLAAPGRLIDIGGWRLQLNCTGLSHSRSATR